ncbi:hypothetical protein Anapl_03575 [Anas platyrhynchos]|uniref:Uncharacterized protein n=1 Tax=Anas platyrhynchos TaxID=8839 RepID=R0LV90_ANAPL|nr:hypothetical protein Anapl_03575 [Anas platyrhynchos]
MATKLPSQEECENWTAFQVADLLRQFGMPESAVLVEKLSMNGSHFLCRNRGQERSGTEPAFAATASRPAAPLLAEAFKGIPLVKLQLVQVAKGSEKHQSQHRMGDLQHTSKPEAEGERSEQKQVFWQPQTTRMFSYLTGLPSPCLAAAY